MVLPTEPRMPRRDPIRGQVQQARRQTREANNATASLGAARPSYFNEAQTTALFGDMPGGNSSLYDANALTRRGQAVSGAFNQNYNAPTVEQMRAAQAGGFQQVPGVVTRNGVSTPMPSMPGGPFLAARDARTQADRRQRQAAQAQRLARQQETFEAIKQQEAASPGGRTTYKDGQMSYEPMPAGGMPTGIADPEKFAARKQRRQDEKALARQRQFARAQYRGATGNPRAQVMFDEDGGVDMTRTAMAQVRDPAAAAQLGMDQQKIEEAQVQALFNRGLEEQRFENESELHQETIKDIQERRDISESERKRLETAERQKYEMEKEKHDATMAATKAQQDLASQLAPITVKTEQEKLSALEAQNEASRIATDRGNQRNLLSVSGNQERFVASDPAVQRRQFERLLGAAATEDPNVLLDAIDEVGAPVEYLDQQRQLVVDQLDSYDLFGQRPNPTEQARATDRLNRIDALYRAQGIEAPPQQGALSFEDYMAGRHKPEGLSLFDRLIGPLRYFQSNENPYR